MGSEVFIIALIFGSIFGVFYLFLSTRNKERLALIEKGADASIFAGRSNGRVAPFWKIFILNLALLLIGIGCAIFIASILADGLGMDFNVAYPGTIFLMAGIALYIGFTMTKKLDREER